MAMFLNCGGKRSRKEHMLLHFEPRISATASTQQPDKGYPFKIKIKKLKLSPLYDNAKLIVRTSDHSIKYARKGVWAIRPNITATDLLTGVLKTNFSFESVKEIYIESSPDYIITGTIVVIEEDLRKKERRASLSVELKITRRSDDKILLENVYSKSAKCKKSGYTALAEQFSLMLDKICATFVLGAVNVFNRELKSRNEKIKSQDL
jgi:ABC-type uncharacterized transport system auxiliary subunit